MTEEKTMLASVFDEFGPPEVVRIASLSVPVAEPGEVVVRVVASTINPTDLMMRSGKQAAMMSHISAPYMAGMEFSGRIHVAGEGVDLPIGTPVIGVVNPRRQSNGGAHAQYIAVPASSVAQVDETVDLIGAATIPMNALTAWLALDMVALEAGQSLLVTGGTGMLGGSVLQLAHSRGIVTVAAGRQDDSELLKAMGTSIILPRDEDLVDAVHKAFPGGVDAMIDGALIGQQASAAVRDGGSAISLRKSHPIEDSRLKVDYVSVLAGMEDNSIMRGLAALINSGDLVARVAEGKLFDFRSAVDAHKAAELGSHRGRVILTFEDR